MSGSTQGQSSATWHKQIALRDFLLAHTAIVAMLQQTKGAGPYCYLETNAGSGWNELVNCEGSPVIATQVLDERKQHQGLDARVVFMEKDAVSALKLVQRLDQYANRLQIFNGDHRELIPTMRLPRNAYGLIYADPNALTDSPERVLYEVFKRKDTSRIDVLFNLNTHIRRRVISGQQAGNPGDYDSLEQLMEKMGKAHWWVRRPVGARNNRWTFLFGSNHPGFKLGGGGQSGLHFYPARSPEGQEILIDLMTGQGSDQLSLFDIPINRRSAQ